MCSYAIFLRCREIFSSSLAHIKCSNWVAVKRALLFVLNEIVSTEITIFRGVERKWSSKSSSLIHPGAARFKSSSAHRSRAITHKMKKTQKKSTGSSFSLRTSFSHSSLSRFHHMIDRKKKPHGTGFLVFFLLFRCHTLHRCCSIIDTYLNISF